MTRADFFAALHTAAPGSTPEAAQKWIDFAAECVSEEQYANFIPGKDNLLKIQVVSMRFKRRKSAEKFLIYHKSLRISNAVALPPLHVC